MRVVDESVDATTILAVVSFDEIKALSKYKFAPLLNSRFKIDASRKSIANFWSADIFKRAVLELVNVVDSPSEFTIAYALARFSSNSCPALQIFGVSMSNKFITMTRIYENSLANRIKHSIDCDTKKLHKQKIENQSV